jgi:CRP/FNR family transcriptional regulator
MKNMLDILAAIPSFHDLSADQLLEIRKIIVSRQFARGELIFSEGDHGDGFYVVAAGLVKIFKLSVDGKEHIMRIVGPGQAFGQVSVYAGRTFPASAQAIAQGHLLFLPRKAFVDLITGNASLALSMLASLSIRLREFTVHVERLALKEVPGRLAAYLIHLMDEQKSEPPVVSLNISKVQLASLLGTTPETLSRILSQMADRGLIEMEKRDFRILDVSGLEELAEYGRNIAD